MSCVADMKATSQNMASVRLKKNGVGSVKAMPAKVRATSHCVPSTQRRLVEKMSTKGLQNGLMTHGR